MRAFRWHSKYEIFVNTIYLPSSTGATVIKDIAIITNNNVKCVRLGGTVNMKFTSMQSTYPRQLGPLDAFCDTRISK